MLAVISALAAPLSMLAQDLGTGQFAGLCSANSALLDEPLTGTETPQQNEHCALCSPPALVMPLKAVQLFVVPADAQAPRRLMRTDPQVAGNGLPFSRGPPSRRPFLFF